MSLRRNNISTIGLATVALLALSGCGADLSPGTAATVNDTSISQDRVDDLVGAVCSYVAISNETSTDPSPLVVSDLRSSITGALISFELIDSVTEDLGLTIVPASVVVGADPTTNSMSDAEAKLLNDFFYNGAKAQVQESTIGAHLRDDSITSSADATSKDVALASDYLKGYFAKADITVSPAFGTWDGFTVNATSGSLSDGVSDEATSRIVTSSSPPVDVSKLPPSQVCG